MKKNLEGGFNKYLIGACVFLYVFFAFLHYFSQRPLWLDEQFVFASVESYNYGQIFGPLKTQQAFPRVYLALVKALSMPFDYHLLALRFLSLVFMLAAFFVWLKLYKQNTKNTWQLALLLLSFACSYRLTYYGAELKHYSMDVLTVALFSWYLGRQQKLVHEKPRRLDYGCVVCLPLLLFFSYSGLFVFWMVVWNLVLMVKRNQSLKFLLALSVLSSLTAFITFYQIDLRYSFQQKGILAYWQSYFLCTDSPGCFSETFFEGIKRLVVYWCGTEKWQYRAAVIFLPFFIYSLFRYGVRAVKEHKGKIFGLEAIVFTMFIELCILGALKYYPFTGERITLFFAPFVFYLVLKGMNDLRTSPVAGREGKLLGNIVIGYYIIYCLVCALNTLGVYVRLYQ